MMRILIFLITIALFFTKEVSAQHGFTVGSPELAYWEFGSGSKTVIVLHGGPGAAHDYLIPEWNNLIKSARVIYYDQRGCGKSKKADCYSWREHVLDLKRIITQKSPGSKVVLAGSSWGSTLALLYSYQYPQDVEGLILSGTYNWIGKGGTEKDCESYLPRNPGVSLQDERFRLMPLKSYSDSLKGLRDDKFTERHPISTSMVIKSMIDAPILEELSKVKQPVLIFKGKETCPETPVREGADIYAGILQNVEIYFIPAACHDPWLSHTAEFFAKCDLFLKRLK